MFRIAERRAVLPQVGLDDQVWRTWRGPLMSYYLATKTSIADWIKGLASGNSVYFPAKHGQSSYRFTQVQSDSEIQFERYTPTVVPPVKLLLPAREELLQFRKNADGKSEVQRFTGHLVPHTGGRQALRPQGDLPDGSLFQGWSPRTHTISRAAKTLPSSDTLVPLRAIRACSARRWNLSATRKAPMFL